MRFAVECVAVHGGSAVARAASSTAAVDSGAGEVGAPLLAAAVWPLLRAQAWPLPAGGDDVVVPEASE
jgi:hypothetical protein